MAGLRGSLAYSFLERWLSIIIALGSNVLLARLLTPETIGVFSVSLAVIGIAQVLRDFGVVSFVIQERQLTVDHLRTAFGISLLLGVSMFLLVFFGAPWVALFYGEPLVQLSLQICALNFLILPFCTISLALLRRDMAFDRVAFVGLLGAGAGAAVSVGMAWLEFGVTSLAVGAVVVNAVTGLAAFWVRPVSHVLRPSLKEWRRLLNYGAQSSLTGVVTSLSMDVNDLAVGKVMGFEPVAVLSKAQGLMSLFHRDVMTAIRNVLHPAIAKAAREDVPLEPFYLNALTNVTVLAWPFYGFVALYAIEILRLMFGPQWDSAAPLVPVYCLAGAVAAFGSMVGTMFLALGRIDLTTRVELIFQPCRAAVVVAAAVVFQDMEACAWALVLALTLQVPLLYRYKTRCVPNDWGRLRRQVGHSLGVSLLSLVLPLVPALVYGLGRSTPMPGWAFAAACASCAGSWLIVLVATRHPLALDPAFRRLLLRRRA